MGRVYAFGGQSITERDHGPVVGGEIRRSGNFMETDQVDPALDAVQAGGDSSRICRGESFSPLMTMYSNDTRRWCVKSYLRRIGRDLGDRPCPFDGHDGCPLLVEGLCRLTARCTFVLSSNRRNSGTTPAVESVMRVGDQPKPHSAVRMSSA